MDEAMYYLGANRANPADIKQYLNTPTNIHTVLGTRGTYLTNTYLPT